MASPNLGKAAANLPTAVKAVNKLLEANMTEADYNDPKYALRVYVIPKTVNNPKKADQAVTYAPPGSALEMAVKLVERPKHRAKELVQMVRLAGHADFNTAKFIACWKALDLKKPDKGLAVELGGQWFWYPETLQKVLDFLAPVAANDVANAA